MKEIDRLVKIYQRQPLPFPALGKKILETLLLKTEREFFELLNEKEISEFLLKVANLPQYRKEAPEITDLRKALLILGEDFVKLLLLGIIAKKLIRTTFNEFSFPRFWARALANACFVQVLSSQIEDIPSHLFVSAFLMDFGILVLYSLSPEGYLKVLRLREAGKTLLEAEREVFQTDHPTIGGEYFENCCLPRRLVLTIYNHHISLTQLPEEVPQDVYEDIKKIQVIDAGVGSYFSVEREFKHKEYLKLAQNHLYLKKETAEYLLELLPETTNQLFAIFDLEEFSLIPYSKWLKEEEKKLAERLKLIEEHKKEEENLLEKYKGEIAKLLREKELLLQEIHSLKKKISEHSILDELTGIYNQEFLLKRLQEEILRSKRYRRTFSFLLVEIEKFYEITERFGSNEEERVLKDLAERITHSLRRVDIVAKLNDPGQFAIILPETNAQGAWVVARKVSGIIEKYFWERFKIKKSAFISIITFEPQKLDPKKDTPALSIFRFSQAGLRLLKEKSQKNIIVLRIDREIEKV